MTYQFVDGHTVDLGDELFFFKITPDLLELVKDVVKKQHQIEDPFTI